MPYKLPNGTTVTVVVSKDEFIESLTLAALAGEIQPGEIPAIVRSAQNASRQERIRISSEIDEQDAAQAGEDRARAEDEMLSSRGSSEPTAKKSASASYLGCFKDPNRPFDLDGYLERSAQNTPQRCVATCAARGFPYAGVQYDESCLCGQKYGRFDASSVCTMKCTGDGSQICGGYEANSVYSTGK